MKFRPLHDRVVVKRIDAEEKTAGGIIIPDSAKEKPSQGEIVAVGPGGRDEAGKLIPIDLKVGDRVLFGKWSGTEVKIDGQELLIMKESDIVGVLTDVPATKKKAALANTAHAHPEGRLRGASPKGETQTSTQGNQICQLKKSNSASMPATACSAASTFSPTPSR